MAQRTTRQRQVLRDVFTDAGRPLRAQEAHELAQQELPRLGQATVYRAINDLVTEGWLRSVELPGEPARYERTGLGHHHHFHCRQCQRVYDIHDCPGNLRSLAPKGFVVESHEVVLYGVCEGCASAA